MDSLVQFNNWFYRNQYRLLRWSLGLIYLWFGMLKFFPNQSPAEQLAKDTIHALFFGIIPDNWSIVLLAIWEVLIGIFFLSGYFKRPAIKAAIVHMLFTFTPMFLFVDLAFTSAPYAFTIIGQYIMKNLVFLVAMGMLMREDQA
ncbi:MAG: DoxX family membrane protein [Saprospiraceae bacterium]|jgi:uncharacterized membrane protein YphA (DoxX/SURF4 family)